MFSLSFTSNFKSTIKHLLLFLFHNVTPSLSKNLQNKFVLIDIRAISKENSEIKEKIKTTKIEIDRVVSELSKKVDSRVDKAIESMKKQK